MSAYFVMNSWWLWFARKVCILSWVIWAWFLERDTAVAFYSYIFFGPFHGFIYRVAGNGMRERGSGHSNSGLLWRGHSVCTWGRHSIGRLTGASHCWFFQMYSIATFSSTGQVSSSSIIFQKRQNLYCFINTTSETHTKIEMALQVTGKMCTFDQGPNCPF